MPEHDLESIAFPTLDEAQIATLSRCSSATPKVYRDGEILFAIGERNFKFHVIKSGEVKILDYTGDSPKIVTTHRKGGFTGDVSHLTGNPSVVSAVADGDCEVYEISGDALRQVLNQCPALSDIVLQAFIARRQLLRQTGGFTGLRVIGSRYSADTFRVRDFLSKNRVLFTWVDVENDPQVDRLLKQFGVTEADTPVVACSTKLLLRNPSNRDLAERIGIHQGLDQTVYDLVVVGAGPAGLAAAVYGASEGLRTAVLERNAPGGQAGTSMRIENYLGFPTGISGGELAFRAEIQALKFGARVTVPNNVVALHLRDGHFEVELEYGGSLSGRSVVIATGARYRKLGLPHEDTLGGIYYSATELEARSCGTEAVVVVGGGNSAGQAAMFLADRTRQVHLVHRRENLEANMSQYLIARLEQTPNVHMHLDSWVSQLHGHNQLVGVTLDRRDGTSTEIAASGLFIMIGVEPCTEWLRDSVALDAKGFVLTGLDLPKSVGQPHFEFETSVPGVFAAGDVRSGSVKRVASSVGEVIGADVAGDSPVVESSALESPAFDALPAGGVV